MYRPTVRYSEAYKNHINDLFRATTLDRNQILRLALHVAAHSNQFKQILSKYKKGDVPIPHPDWGLDFNGLWMENSQETEERGGYVNANIRRDRQTERVIESVAGSPRVQEHSDRCEPQIQRQEREIPTKPTPVRNQGGITIKIG